MLKKIILILVIIFVLGGGIFLFRQKSDLQKEKPEVHYHAGFLVYMDGRLQDFSDFKFMSITPCNEKEEPARNASQSDAGGEQLEKAHLHDGIGDVVHIHRPNTVWQDLFKNLNFSFDSKKKITTYLNGGETDNLLNQPIVPYDSVIFISGDTKGIDIEKYVTVEHIKDVESKSESCGT